MRRGRVPFAKIRPLIWRTIMKPLLPVAVAAALALCAASALAQSMPGSTAQQANAPIDPPARSANEAAGLPDLATINRPAAESSASVELNTPREPSFHERSGSGTEITEFRDRGKPVEIDVHSGFGTHYQMSAPTDTSPKVRNNGQASTRLPSLNLSY
jgi:hypothetical protein